MIPKIIWQTHQWEWDYLPNNYRSAAMTWKNLNPGWEYRYVDAIERAEHVAAFDRTLYLFYKNMDNTSQADLWRYIITYRNGGVYADMDSICVSPLDHVLSKMPPDLSILAAPVDSSGLVNNANFGTRKENYIIGIILDKICDLLETEKLISTLEEIEKGLPLKDALQLRIKLSPENFSPTLLEYSENVWFNYDAVFHSSDIKNPKYRVPKEFKVDFYGEEKLYRDLAIENNWNLL